MALLEQAQLLEFLNSVPIVRSKVELLVSLLHRKQLTGPHYCAKATISILKIIIENFQFQSTNELIQVVRSTGHILAQASPTEFSIGNSARRVLYFIREVHQKKFQTMLKESASISSSLFPPTTSLISQTPSSIHDSQSIESSLSNSLNKHCSVSSITPLPSSPISPSSSSTSSTPSPLSLSRSSSSASYLSSPPPPVSASLFDWEEENLHFLPLDLISDVLGEIGEYEEELDSMTSSLIETTTQSTIHEGERVLFLVGGEAAGTGVTGGGGIVESMIKSLAKKRKFHILLNECSPSMEGHKLAHSLSQLLLNMNKSCSVTLVPDASLFALLPKIDKIFLTCCCVTRDGGVVCGGGGGGGVNIQIPIAMTAKEMNIPVIALSASYQLTPFFSPNAPASLSSTSTTTSPSLFLPADSSLYLPLSSTSTSFSSSSSSTEEKTISLSSITASPCPLYLHSPSFDVLSPSYLSLHLTNQGTFPPSYLFRLFSELYHEKDMKLFL